jgi:hypothetical protein
MEVSIHPKTDIKEGDLFRVDHIYNDRLDMSTLKYGKTARLEKIDQNNLIDICKKLIKYRDNNTLNFQLEKLDDYLDTIRQLITE